LRKSVRPRSITIISWFFIIFGSIALLSGVLPFRDLMSHWYVHLSRLLMIIAGVFMLKGHNWARWLIVVWITFHIIISALHSPLFLLMHVVIFSAILYFVFRREASAYFLVREADET
jgi:hypothetical protein